MKYLILVGDGMGDRNRVGVRCLGHRQGQRRPSVDPRDAGLLDRLGQRETAKKLGVSQMQVSRMERRVLARLRAIEESGA